MRVKLGFLICLLVTSTTFAQDDLPGIGNIRMDVFSDTGLKNKVHSGLVPNIDFLWRWDAPVSALKTPRDFSVRLRGFLRAPRNGHLQNFNLQTMDLRTESKWCQSHLDQFADRGARENPVSIPEEAIFPTKRSISQGQ